MLFQLINYFKKPKYLILFIILISFLLRIYNLSTYNSYIFDEVYHGFTAKEYLKGNRNAWDPWARAPVTVAYEWTHPPLAKEIMSLSMYLFRSIEAWAWRLPGVLLGILSVYLVYLLAKQLFKKESVALLSAFIFSLDGLNFAQSRIGMNDIYLVTFSLASILFFIKQRYLLSSLFLGLAFSCKWTAIFLLIFYILILIKKQPKKILILLVIVAAVYLGSYLPYFLLNYSINDFILLQKQMYLYHTNLKASHSYSSPWWSWPLNLYPVWYFVDYQGNKIVNIFSMGNHFLFWSGLIFVIISIYQVLKKKTNELILPLTLFFLFWLPWTISPRIMFIYHFSPAVPFLAMILSYQIYNLYKINYKILADSLLILIVLNFLLIYPFLVGIPLSLDLINLFFLTNLAKNPF